MTDADRDTLDRLESKINLLLHRTQMLEADVALLKLTVIPGAPHAGLVPAEMGAICGICGERQYLALARDGTQTTTCACVPSYRITLPAQDPEPPRGVSRDVTERIPADNAEDHRADEG